MRSNVGRVVALAAVIVGASIGAAVSSEQAKAAQGAASIPALEMKFPMSVSGDDWITAGVLSGARAYARAEVDQGSGFVAGKDITFSDMLVAARAGLVVAVEVSDADNKTRVDMVDGETKYVTVPASTAWAVDLAKTGVDVKFGHGKLAPQTQGEKFISSFDTIGSVIARVFAVVIPCLMLFMLFWVTRTMRSEKGVGQFVDPKSAAGKTRFTDVAGVEDAKEILNDVVEFLKNPHQYAAIGARPRKGVLLVGPPGNGKTLLARAVAGEAGVPFLFISGSAFTEMFVGVGAARVRKLFKRLRKKGRCVLFIDEIDSIGRHRSEGGGGAEAEKGDTLNELLTQLDGLGGPDGIVFIGATNRVDVLDPALLRPGRFDIHVSIGQPDLRAREQILAVAARDVKIGADVDFRVVARGSSGSSGADLTALVNEAAIRAAKRGATEVADEDFEAARDAKLLGGEARKGEIMDESEREVVIYHETGHAMARVLQPECDPVHKGTIQPRGQALGFVASLPQRERVLHKRSKLLAELVVIMAGRAAEEVVFGGDDITSGAASDIHEATKLARTMVTKLGFGTTLSTRVSKGALAEEQLSERSLEAVDAEVEKLVRDAHDRAVAMIETHRSSLEALAARFREAETLTGVEITEAVMGALESDEEKAA